MSGKFDPKYTTRRSPTKNQAICKQGYEEGVPEKPFPDDLSEVRNSSVNNDTTKNKQLWVELIPGTFSDNDGHAIIHSGSFTGPVVDDISLSDNGNSVIWSDENIHVKGMLDGRLSIGSGNNVIIEDNVVYGKPPDPTKPLSDAVNQTRDMLGLIANNNVEIASTYHGDIAIHGSVFTRTGGFEVQDVTTRGVEGRINLLGSIAQHDRGVIGQFSGGTLNKGYLKNYRYDNRLNDPLHATDPNYHPPAFPGYRTPGPLRVTNWWESARIPFDVDRFQ